MLKQKFELIKNTTCPLQKKSWKCSRLCHAGKTTFEGTHVTPLVENRFGSQTQSKYGEYMTKCDQIKYMIDKYGIDWVTTNLMAPDHVIGKYKAPGELS